MCVGWGCGEACAFVSVCEHEISTEGGNIKGVWMDQSSPVADLKSSINEFKKCTLVSLQWPWRLLDWLE